mgnify:CR=1 FL=1
MEKQKTACLAPWISIHNWPDGNVYPCCLWDSGDPIGNANEQSLQEIWNSDKMKDTRLKMLSGKKVDACSRCYLLESTGDSSYRQRINREHKKYESYLKDTNKDGSLDFMNFHLWDLRISNFCNFKCRSCGAGLSSSWHKDAIELGITPKDSKALININDKTNFLKQIEAHYSCVDEIYFAGGEPLIMPEHYIILDELIQRGKTDVTIRYSTNFSKLEFKHKHIFDYWKQFDNLELYISIDGVGKVGEYVRSGYDDLQFEKNIKAFKNSGIKFKHYGYAVTYGALNYLHLFDLVLDFIDRDFIDTTKPEAENRTVFFSPISYPTHYDCKFLPNRYKNEFKKRLDNFTQELEVRNTSHEFNLDILSKLSTVYKTSLTADFDYKEMLTCKEYTEKLDKMRKEKLVECIPYFNSTQDFIKPT